MAGNRIGRFVTLFALSIALMATMALSARAHTSIMDAVLESAQSVPRPQPAFKGAEGFGAYTQGGRGGRKLVVTSLSDDGSPGTLRWAVEQKGARQVSFEVEGTIVLQKNLVISHPQITIDGSTAPGIGITLKDGTLLIDGTHDVVIRYLRVRPGDEVALHKGIWKKSNREEAPEDGINIRESAYVIVDHCSVSWSSDEGLSVVGGDYVTVQWCFIYEPLANSALHGGQSHPFGSLITGRHISYLKNLVAFYAMRGPQVTNEREAQIEVVNNCLYYYTQSGTGVKFGRDTNSSFLLLNNSYNGAQRKSTPDILLMKDKGIQTFPQKYLFSQAYLSGNIGPRRGDPNSDEWSGTSTQFDKEQTQSIRSDTPPFKSQVDVIFPTAQVCAMILNEGGATRPKRDTIDSRVIDLIEKGGGRLVKSQDDVGGYREFAPR